MLFLPHRCECIDGLGDVILSGDPDGGRPDLFGPQVNKWRSLGHLDPKSFIEQSIPIQAVIS